MTKTEKYDDYIVAVMLLMLLCVGAFILGLLLACGVDGNGGALFMANLLLLSMFFIFLEAVRLLFKK